MNYPNLNEEKKLWKKGYRYVAGIDEVGRGPLAGSVVACAVTINLKHKIQNKKLQFENQKLLKETNDSKKLSAKKREELYGVLISHNSHKEIEWGIGKVSEKVIDKINIKNAAELAMYRAIKKLKKMPDFLLIDGNHLNSKKLKAKKHKLIIRGDSKVFSIACASIIAKVTRDRMMMQCHRKYPQYGFDKHKGYPTKLHKKMIKKYGILVVHRKTFYPLKKRGK